MEDKSIIKNTADINETYIDDCIKEVCLEGDSLTKYKRMIEKLYGAEFYKKCGVFVKEVKHSVNRKKFTQTSIANLNHLANEINVTSSTIETLIDYYTKKFADDEKTNKKATRKSVKREDEKDIEEVTALMKKVAEAESKKTEAARKRKETAERKKKEADERMRLMSESILKEVEEEKKKAEERRKRAEERRRQQRLDIIEKQRREEEKERQQNKTEDEGQGRNTAIGCVIIIALFLAGRLIWPDLFSNIIGVIIVIVFFGFIIWLAKELW